MKNVVLLLSLFLSGFLQANAQDYLKEANACFEKGDYECAKKNYNLFQIWNSNDMSAEIRKADECMRALILADNYFAEEEYEKASDRYRDVLVKNPQDPHAKKQYEACKELLAPVNAGRAPETRQFPDKAAPRTSSSGAGYRKNAFGADLGFGSRNLKNGRQGTYKLGATLDLGVRYTYSFSPHFGWDAVNLKFQAVMDSDGKESLFQAMTGIGACTPAFAQNMKGYVSIKAGYGKMFTLDDAGFAYELEIGAYLAKAVSLSFVYNAQSLQGKFSEQSGSFSSAYAGLRLGVSF